MNRLPNRPRAAEHLRQVLQRLLAAPKGHAYALRDGKDHRERDDAPVHVRGEALTVRPVRNHRARSDEAAKDGLRE